MTEAGGAAAFYLPVFPADTQIREWNEVCATVLKRALTQDQSGRAAMVADGIANAGRFSAAAMAQRYVAIYRELLYKP